MDRLKIGFIFCIALVAAVVLSPPQYYNQIRAYYYRYVGGRLVTPDKRVPTRPVAAIVERVAKKPVRKVEPKYAISGLDPTLGPQITVLAEPQSDASVSSSAVVTTETPEQAQQVEAPSAGNPEPENPGNSLAQD
jgi:hypothetical protein